MTKARLAIRLKGLALVAGAAVSLTTLGARRAAAFDQNPGCSPTFVQYEAAQQYLIVGCGGVNYFAATLTSGNCTAQSRSVDQQKLFMSLAESALLSGKIVTVYSNTCEGRVYIEAMDLSK
jgi:hypothetical protein